jgi:hypothetical protein
MDPLAPLLEDYGGGICVFVPISPGHPGTFTCYRSGWPLSLSLLIITNKQPVYLVLRQPLSEPRNQITKRVNSRNITIFEQISHRLTRMIFYLAGPCLRLLARR